VGCPISGVNGQALLVVIHHEDCDYIRRRDDFHTTIDDPIHDITILRKCPIFSLQHIYWLDSHTTLDLPLRNILFCDLLHCLVNYFYVFVQQ
jgi:hypothetical protein